MRRAQISGRVAFQPADRTVCTQVPDRGVRPIVDTGCGSESLDQGEAGLVGRPESGQKALRLRDCLHVGFKGAKDLPAGRGLHVEHNHAISGAAQFDRGRHSGRACSDNDGVSIRCKRHCKSTPGMVADPSWVRSFMPFSTWDRHA